MKKIEIPRLVIFFVILNLFACNMRQKSVWFQELRDTYQKEDCVVRIYLDKWGDFYPDKSTFIPYKYFFDPDSSGRTYRNLYTSQKRGSLSYYYTSRAYRWDTLSNIYDSTLTRSLTNFDSIQNIIQANYARQINGSLDAIDPTLVIFIHGFNDPNPTGDYFRMRAKINQLYPGNNFVFLEVYWDGQTANQRSPAFSRIWSFAQSSSSGVAFSLRELLNRVHLNAKVRIITHSLGASVGTGTLFNTISKWKSSNFYTEHICSVHAPRQKDIRICMFAPAIPGKSTFCDFLKRSGRPIIPDSNNISKIIVAFNPHDYAVSKAICGRNFLAIHAGATSLGADYRNEIKDTRDSIYKLMGKDTVNLFRSFRFCETTVEKEEHGLYFYMQDMVQLDRTLHCLFDE